MHLAGLSSSQSLPPDFPFFSILSFKDYGRQLAPFSPRNTRCQVRFCRTTQCREIEHRQLDPRAMSQPWIHSTLSSPPHPQTLNPFSFIAAYNIRRRHCIHKLYMGLAVETSIVGFFLGSRVQDLCEGVCSSEKVYILGLCVLLCAYGFNLVAQVHEFQMDLF